MKIKVIFIIVLPLLLFCNISIYGQGVSIQSTDKYNPGYHFYPSIDPTGLFFYAGQYFLNWGSATSKDLVHWKMTPYGLSRRNRQGTPFGGIPGQQPTGDIPGQQPTGGISGQPPTGGNRNQQAPDAAGNRQPQLNQPQVIGGLSGSAVVDWNNTTGAGKNGNPPLIGYNISPRGTNFYYSNDTAKTWFLYEKPAVLPNSSGSARDPKLFWYEPDKKWVMLMPWCEIQEIRFFSSKNLVDWEYMSKFGPWGAVGGQWECVDFFPLPVDGNQQNIKWVLVIGLQPRNGQYFIGDFDGKRFTMDKSYIDYLSYDRYKPSGITLFDFERGIDEWKMEGNAFIDCPTVAEGTNGKGGSRSIKAGRGNGKLTSPEFLITKNFINFMVGGGYDPDGKCVNLLIDGKTVRTQSGNSGNAHLNWAGWDVTEFRGKKARIEIVNNTTSTVGGSMGSRTSISCDDIMLCDELPKPAYEEYNPGWEKAFWFDWGQDFYAQRTWTNYAPDEKRMIVVGWMGNWRYNNEPILGNFSIPRSLELKTLPEGIRIVQTPIKELESLRTSHKVAGENTFEGTWSPKKILPAQNMYELIVEFENISAEEFGLNLCIGGNQKTVVGYNVSREELYVDRRKSGYADFNALFPSITRGPLKNRSNTTKLHIFIDKCSVEVLGNIGETTISDKIYPDPTSIGIELFSNNGKVKVKSLDLWELNSIDLYGDSISKNK
jgi:sucrose-6-phosphate hydrolase SacC (GH32 family)